MLKSKVLSFIEKHVIDPLMGVKPEAKVKQNYADTIVRNAEGDIFLLQRSTNDDFMPGKWCLPGGKMEVGEDKEFSAKRELQEETGLDLPLIFLKTIDREGSTTHYFITQLPAEPFLPTLDNEEHYRYDFVPYDKLDRYDLLLDLGTVLEGLADHLQPIEVVEPETELTPEIITKAFDDGLIEDEDYLRYIKINKALNTIKKAHVEGSVSDEDLSNAIAKSKHYEFVKVNRDSKTFYQYREVGTDKLSDDIETGEVVEAEPLGLKVTKYSDKSLLITGETYKNLELLRKIKADAGIGSWNKTLNGWFFPNSVKSKIFAALAEKMPVETYDETAAREAAIELKNSIDPGTPVIDPHGEEKEVSEVVTDEKGEVKYQIDVDGVTEEYTEEQLAIPPADDKKAEELINNATEENRFKTGKELFGKEEGEKSISAEVEAAGQQDIKIQAKEFTTRSGEVVNALDFTSVPTKDIQLSDQETILDKAKPYFIPEVNEYRLESNNQFLFDYVKMSDGNFLVALNGYAKDGTITNTDVRYKNADPAYAVMSLDNLVALTEYYKLKRKAEYKKSATDYNKSIVDKYKNLTPSQIDQYKPYSYSRLSHAQTKKIGLLAWEAMPMEEKLNWVEGMSAPVYAKRSVKKIKILEDDRMMRANFNIYKQFVNKEYKTPFDTGSRFYHVDDECVIEFSEAREQIKWKANDLQIQREENDGSYKKGRETSYGYTNLKDDLLASHGVKIKSQSGKELGIEKTEQIKTSLSAVYESFGDRSSMAKQFGLKISHAGEKLMHASTALGLYVPSMNAIGVSDNQVHGKFGFTLAHEFSHFIDNYAGKKLGKNFASDDFESIAGKIANTFRKNMNVKTDNRYINKTCECFARSFEQYHAMKSVGEDAIKSVAIGVPYHQSPEHVNKEKFNTLIKPLIEQFLAENDHILKGATDELQIFNISDSFDLIKAAFDNDEITPDEYLTYQKKYGELIKAADPSHGGKLERVVMIDSKGKKEVKWVSKEEAKDGEKPPTTDKTKHTYEKLHEFAKDTPLAELKRVINESHDEKLRKAAHKEIDRREQKEKVKKKELAKK